MAVVASPHDPLEMPVQLAELIGQLQHLIELAEARDVAVYDPVVVDLSVATSQTINLPAEAHQLASVQLSSDTAATVKLYRVDQRSGPSGQLIGQLYLPAGAAGIPLMLNCPMPPTAAQLTITTSVAITSGAAVVVLGRVRPGGYPYAG